MIAARSPRRVTTRAKNRCGRQGRGAPIKRRVGEAILCPICVVKEVGNDDRYKRWNGRISLGTTMRLTQVSARELFDRHWNPAPGEAAHATPPGNPAPGEAALHDRRMGRRGLEVRIEQLEKEVEDLKTLVTKEVEELKTLVTQQGVILKQVADKVAEWSWLEERSD